MTLDGRTRTSQRTSTQLALVDTPTTPRLTERQQRAYDYIRDHHGVTADEIGAHLHAHRDRRPHSVDQRCDWCARDGLAVLQSKALAPLITYRRTGEGRLYILRGTANTTTGYDPATAEIPF